MLCVSGRVLANTRACVISASRGCIIVFVVVGPDQCFVIVWCCEVVCDPALFLSCSFFCFFVFFYILRLFVLHFSRVICYLPRGRR